ncbi:hypothetical protein M878_10830 [Streptomyces roseochromogenus subsp. oscitans DS 12.976]|uniref:Uncharacterized protein n=1 Tax=Streptomyces roseochromogenus subsp. oscitans DS 12.976 TaxID=1352936 RepID=V6KQE8_STRRC|nr:hypothetical protein M878_10830 [Streptomyces roseochromogenus subsp. oscitans DS 12.976]
MDALVAVLPRVEAAPDLGSVREDLLALCRQVRQIITRRPVWHCAR